MNTQQSRVSAKPYWTKAEATAFAKQNPGKVVWRTVLPGGCVLFRPACWTATRMASGDSPTV